MKGRTPSSSPPTAKLQKMTPGLAVDADTRSHMSGSASSTRTTATTETGSHSSYAKDDDYSSFMSDVLVVGAGPAGLMLA